MSRYWRQPKRRQFLPPCPLASLHPCIPKRKMPEQGHWYTGTLAHKADIKSQKNISMTLRSALCGPINHLLLAGGRRTYPYPLSISIIHIHIHIHIHYPLSNSELGRGTEKKETVTKVRATFQVEIIRQSTRASDRNRHLTTLKLRDEL